MVIEMMEFSFPKHAKEQDTEVQATDSVLIVGRGMTLIGDVMLVSEGAVIQIKIISLAPGQDPLGMKFGFLILRIIINSEIKILVQVQAIVTVSGDTQADQTMAERVIRRTRCQVKQGRPQTVVSITAGKHKEYNFIIIFIIIND